MKKTTKILAVILAIVTLMSSFSIVPSAISGKSSAKELLDYYEDSIIRTSAKEDIIMAKTVYKNRDFADYSSLKGKDLEATKKDNEEWEIYTGKWYEDKWNTYYHGDAYEDSYWEGRSEFVDTFSIKRDIRRSDLKFKSAKYSKADNGDVTLVFVYTSQLEDVTTTRTYTVKIDKNNYVKSYSLKQSEKNKDYSVGGKPYSVIYEIVDTNVFVYNKVKATDIELSENKVVLGRDEFYQITAVVKPDNATYKDVYVDWEKLDMDVADCDAYDDGIIEISANGEGTTEFDVCAYGGDVIATVEVVVEYTIFDHIAEFFEKTIHDIRFFFYNLIYGFEDEDYCDANVL